MKARFTSPAPTTRPRPGSSARPSSTRSWPAFPPDRSAAADIGAQQRAEEDGRLAVVQDVATVSLVNVQVPAPGRNRLGDVGEDADREPDDAVAVGDQVPQHVLDRALVLAAAQVNVSRVRA